MNKIYRFITLAAVSCISAVSVFAQDVVLDKTAKKNADGSYTLTLETFATGTAKHVAAKDQPIDAVLVLDLSGSMDFTMSNSGTPVGTGYNTGQLNQLCASQALNTTQEYMVRLETNATNSGAGNVYYKLYVSVYSRVGSTRRVYEAHYWYAGVEYVITCEPRTNNNNYTTTYSRADGGRVSSPHNAAQTIYTNGTTAYSTRLDALKTAVKSFVETLYTRSEGKPVQHKVSIIGFSGNSGYADQNKTFISFADDISIIGSDYEDSIFPIIDAMYAKGGTAPQQGFSKASTELTSSNVRSTSAKVLIFFTDGAPDSNNYANQAISTANTLKSPTNNVEIFSVTTQTLSATSDNYKFLQEVSSNYRYQSTTPTIANYNNSNLVPEADRKYYAAVSNSDALEAVFRNISEGIDTDEEAAIDEEAVLKDIVTTHFILPEGVDGAGIRTYTADIESVDETKTDPKERYIFKKVNGVEEWTQIDTVAVTPVIRDGEPTSINVTGFDFGTNWCGVIQNEENISYQGKKLIIQFDVLPNPDDEGGYFTTNDSASGVYVDGKLYKDKTTGDDATYPLPSPVYSDLVTYIKVENLVGDDVAFYDIICKNGPNAGKIWTVPVRNSVTVDASGNSTYTAEEAKVKLPVTYPAADGSDIFYVYDIVEHNSGDGKSGVWTWAYRTADGKVSSYTGQTLYELVNGVPDPDKPNNHFTFTKTSTGTTVLHDEANIPNEFEAYSTANPGSGSSD